MKRLCIFAAALAVCSSAPVAAAPAPSALLDEAIGKVKALSYRRAQVDWPALEAKVRADAAGASDIVDLLPALNTLVEGLGDGHSFVNASAEDRAAFKARHGREYDSTRVAHKPSSPFKARRTPAVAAVVVGGKSAALVTVPMMMGGGAKAGAYAQTLFDGIAATAGQRCGYIVDLRGNGGGNVWPMLAGLSPLLGEPWNGYDIKTDGTISTYATIWRGKATIVDKADPNAGVTFLEIDRWKPLPALVRAPVALLIDDAVASSGEGVALAFKGRPNSRSFGGKTYGLASSNEGFMLADRVNVVVTSGLMIDRLRRTYPDGVAPDEVVANPPSADAAHDPVVEAATRWLASQAACR